MYKKNKIVRFVQSLQKENENLSKTLFSLLKNKGQRDLFFQTILENPRDNKQAYRFFVDSFSTLKMRHKWMSSYSKIYSEYVNGLFKKAQVEAKKYLKEFKLDNFDELQIGSEIKASLFNEGDIVDVTGTSKGHGFSGVIKRWNAHRLKMTHGTGPVHREVGSMSANSSPSRVFKNKHMPGQYGNEQVTKQNLKVVKVDEERNLLLIKGGIPGNKNSLVTICSAKKASK